MRHRWLQRRISLRHKHRNGAYCGHRPRTVCATDCHVFQGVPPVSLTEWTIGVDGKPDFYDVSLVDGSNLPMTITSNKGCPTASCPVDLNPACEQSLAFKGFSLVQRFFYLYTFRSIRIGLQGREWRDRGVQEFMLREPERGSRYAVFFLLSSYHDRYRLI
jgi:hypothetical protein